MEVMGGVGADRKGNEENLESEMADGSWESEFLSCLKKNKHLDKMIDMFPKGKQNMSH